MSDSEQMIKGINELFCMIDKKLDEIRDAMERLIYFRVMLENAVEEVENASCKRD